MTTIEKPNSVRRSQAERSADTRRKVVEAAVRCLSERGYAATTTTSVAIEAGVTRGAMFHQYPTKIDLMLDVARHKYEEETRLYLELLEPIVDITERFFSLPRVMWDVSKRPLGIAMIEIVNGSRSDPELARRLAPLEAANDMRGMSDTADALSEAGLDILAPDLPMVRLVIAAIRGLVMERMVSADPDDLDLSVAKLREIMEAYYSTRSISPAQG